MRRLDTAAVRAHAILDEVRAGRYQPPEMIRWALHELGDLP